MDIRNTANQRTGSAHMGAIAVNTAIVPQQTEGLTAFVEPFLADQCNVMSTSINGYRFGLKRFLEWLEMVSQLPPSRDTIIAYKRSMEAQSLSANTLSTYLVVVRKFFEWLEGMKLYPNVARGVKGARSGRGFRKDCLTRDQVRELLACIDRSDISGKRDYALLNLLIRTGLRTVEAIRADVADIRQELLSPAVLSAIVSKVNYKLKSKLTILRRQSKNIMVERQGLRSKLSNIIAAVESGVVSDSLQQKLTDYESRLDELDAKSEALNRSYDFDKFRVDSCYVEGWLERIRELANADVLLAKSRITALVGEFVLSPETINGINYLRVKSNASIDGLLALAAGEKRKSPDKGIPGGGYSAYCNFRICRLRR